jgi:DMSO reductase anchor subunit
MCANRLSAGEAPACVQACPSEAIRIVVADKAVVTASARSGEFLPLAPGPAYTQPTTRYKSKKPVPYHLIAGDHGRAKPSESHLPLVFMLVLNQLGVGASVAATLAEPSRLLTMIAAFAAALAPCVALLHLGKPLKAWRAFLGWRTSWFSREVIAFGVFVSFAVGSVASTIAGSTALMPFVKIGAAVSGLFAVACSAMIYVDTRREFWRASQSFGRFFETALLLGAAATFLLEMSAGVQTGFLVASAVLVVGATVAKLVLELCIFRHLNYENTLDVTPLGKSARLLVSDLGFALRMRIGCAVLGGLLFPALSVFALVFGGVPPAVLAAMVLGTFVFCLAGELLERYLFFTAVAPERMPGGFVA